MRRCCPQRIFLGWRDECRQHDSGSGGECDLLRVSAARTDLSDADAARNRAPAPVRLLAEIGQLSGHVALVDGNAEGDAEALLIPPDKLRALILRRVSLIQGGVI